jgi:hypothetical protein
MPSRLNLKCLAMMSLLDAAMEGAHAGASLPPAAALHTGGQLAPADERGPLHGPSGAKEFRGGLAMLAVDSLLHAFEGIETSSRWQL